MFSRRIPKTFRQIRNIHIKPPLLNNKIYTETNEWMYQERDCTKMGLSNTAVEQLGDLVFIDFSVSKGDVVKQDDEMLSIESVKAVGTINAPYDCVILSTNDIFENDEALVNLSENPECVDENWIIKIDKIP